MVNFLVELLYETEMAGFLCYSRCRKLEVYTQ